MTLKQCIHAASHMHCFPFLCTPPVMSLLTLKPMHAASHMLHRLSSLMLMFKRHLSVAHLMLRAPLTLPTSPVRPYLQINAHGQSCEHRGEGNGGDEGGFDGVDGISLKLKRTSHALCLRLRCVCGMHAGRQPVSSRPSTRCLHTRAAPGLHVQHMHRTRICWHCLRKRRRDVWRCQRLACRGRCADGWNDSREPKVRNRGRKGCMGWCRQQAHHGGQLCAGAAYAVRGCRRCGCSCAASGKVDVTSSRRTGMWIVCSDVR